MWSPRATSSSRSFFPPQLSKWHGNTSVAISCAREDSVFVEANSIGLEALEQIDRMMAEQNIPLVDAAFNGVAHRLEDLGLLHISGPEAGSVEAICRGLLRVNWLGAEIGSASRLKLLMSGIAKGLVALFLEVGALAEQADMSDSFLESCHEFYPALMTVIERVLLTYPRHAARRAGEIRDIEQMGRAFAFTTRHDSRSRRTDTTHGQYSLGSSGIEISSRHPHDHSICGESLSARESIGHIFGGLK